MFSNSSLYSNSDITKAFMLKPRTFIDFFIDDLNRIPQEIDHNRVKQFLKNIRTMPLPETSVGRLRNALKKIFKNEDVLGKREEIEDTLKDLIKQVWEMKEDQQFPFFSKDNSVVFYVLDQKNKNKEEQLTSDEAYKLLWLLCESVQPYYQERLYSSIRDLINAGVNLHSNPSDSSPKVPFDAFLESGGNLYSLFSMLTPDRLLKIIGKTNYTVYLGPNVDPQITTHEEFFVAFYNRKVRESWIKKSQSLAFIMGNKLTFLAQCWSRTISGLRDSELDLAVKSIDKFLPRQQIDLLNQMEPGARGILSREYIGHKNKIKGDQSPFSEEKKRSIIDRLLGIKSSLGLNQELSYIFSLATPSSNISEKDVTINQLSVILSDLEFLYLWMPNPQFRKEIDVLKTLSRNLMQANLQKQEIEGKTDEEFKSCADVLQKKGIYTLAYEVARDFAKSFDETVDVRKSLFLDFDLLVGLLFKDLDFSKFEEEPPKNNEKAYQTWVDGVKSLLKSHADNFDFPGLDKKNFKSLEMMCYFLEGGPFTPKTPNTEQALESIKSAMEIELQTEPPSPFVITTPPSPTNSSPPSPFLTYKMEE